MKKPVLTAIIYFFTCAWVSNGQDIRFRHLSTDDGLTHFSVISMYQDERDFIWCGTRNGVSVYNGRQFHEYRYQQGDSTSLFCNTIMSIAGDGDGHVFLHTVQGVAIFDMDLERFSVLYNGTVSAMCYDDVLYFAHRNTIYSYDGSQTSRFFELEDKKEQVVCLSRSGGLLYIGTENKGLYILHPSGELHHPITTGRIGCLFSDSRNRLWVGSWESGLYLFDGDNVTQMRHRPGVESTLSSDFIRTCCQDGEGTVWVGTFNGLNRYDEATGTFNSYLLKENDAENIYSSVWSILCDHQGTLWIGTYYGGLCCLNPQRETFRYFKTATDGSNGLSYPTVGKMTEDNRGNVWICTDGGGLNRYEPSTGNFSWYRHDPSRNSISHDNTKAFWYDSLKNVLWIGTHLGGLNRLDLATGRFTNYYSRERGRETLRSNIISTIVPYGEKLILATQAGVMLFDPASGIHEQLFSGPEGISTIPQVNDVLIDRHQTLWIVATDGIAAYELTNGSLTHYRPDPSRSGTLSSRHIHSLYLDSAGNLWVCSADSGIDLYDYTNDSFTNFSALSGDCVYGILELQSGNLLALTNRGLSLLSRKGGGITVLSEWPMDTINENSAYQTRDGTIYIGTSEGMISLHEHDLGRPAAPFHILPYRLIVNGQEVKPGDGTGILARSLAGTETIILKNFQSVFTLEYAISDFLPGSTGQFMYRLKGFSDNWSPLRESREITYTNLKPGSYTLEIRTAGQFTGTSTGSQLGIRILPPWYATWWAYVLYMAVIISVVYYLVLIYRNRIQLQESLKYERQHTHDVEQLNQSKLRFFTNVSHEFRTPLTLIIGQMEALLQGRSLSPGVYRKFLGIYKNSIQLKELVGELLDFRKQEQGFMKMNVSREDLSMFIYENYLLFREYASVKGVDMVFDKPVSPVFVWFDIRQMQKVVNNILSNALKFTPSGGHIIITLTEYANDVLLEVCDTGCGVAPDEVEKIFDRFYQTDTGQSSTGTGVGLALTKSIIESFGGSISATGNKGEGMTFIIRLRKGSEHFTAEQLEAKDPAGEYTGYSSEYDHENILPPALPDGEPSSIDEENSSDKTGETSGKPALLVVEDNDQLREMLVQIFSPFYAVTAACDGQEGLEVIKQGNFSIVVSDIVMPRMSGIELCKAVKNDIQTCHLPVILLTARTGVEHNLEGLRVGADDYVAKPFNVPILVSRANNLVRGRLVLQEKFSRQPTAGPQILAENPLDKEFLDNVVKIIEKHLGDRKFNVDVLVSCMLIGRTRLFHKLKAITGQTPSDFITAIRLKKAAWWLVNNPELNISEIAYRTGFASARYFSRTFREKYGVIPSQYRKANQAGE